MPKIELSAIGKREIIALSVLLLVFLALRIPGLSLPYHQDEWKTGEIVRSHLLGGLSGHPPFTELIYRVSGNLFGADHLRFTPLIFGVLSALLLYMVVRRRAGIYAALASLALYAFCMYGVFASLMIDTDGAILPTFFLAAVYAYDRFRFASSSASYRWLGVIALVLIIGFLTKLSFVIVFGALALDYLIEMRHSLTRRLLIRAVLAVLACATLGLIGLASAHFLFSSFDISKTIAHALYYVRFEGRGYLQILIQAMKAIFYLSPLLLAPLVLFSRETFTKNRIFAVYLGLGAFFYFVLFDFSQGALDKYLMFTIIPFSAIAGTVIAGVLRDISKRQLLVGMAVGFLGSLILLHLNFLSPQVMPLYPKTAWISAVRDGNWNILMPFTGGDGPIGFYVSFLTIVFGFAFSFNLIFAARFWKRTRGASLTALIIIGIAFNLIFIEEFIHGRINGSAPALLTESLTYIAHSDVKSIITYADTGAYELKGVGKYAGRFYAVPGYEEGHKALFSKHTGHYLVIDVPHLSENSFYNTFFATCQTTFSTSSGVITARVYFCGESDPYAITY